MLTLLSQDIKGIMDGSSCSQSGDTLSQSLPTMEALDLNNSSFTEATVDKQRPLMASVVVTTNESQLMISQYGQSKSSVTTAATGRSATTVRSCKPVKGRRNGKGFEVVMLPGNQENLEPSEVQKPPKKVSLPYVENSIDGNWSRHQEAVSDVTHHTKHHVSSNRTSRKKVSEQQQEKKPIQPVRVTRSTSKLMIAQQLTAAGDSEVYSEQLHPNSSGRVEKSPDEISQSQHSTDSEDSRIKYNKSRGFSAKTKVTNSTRSEMNRMFTNNGPQCNGHQSCTVNRNNVNKRSHIVDDHIPTDSLQPLYNITNSHSGSTTVTVKPHPSQARVYDLVAGKKSKKGKRPQSRRGVLVPHKKKLSTCEDVPTEEDVDPIPPNGDKLPVEDKDDHRQASEQSRNSGESVS